MIYEIINCSPFFLRLTERLFMFSNNPYNIPLFKNIEGDGFLMEEEPRSIPMTRQADLSRMPDSRIVRPIRWDPRRW